MAESEEYQYFDFTAYKRIIKKSKEKQIHNDDSLIYILVDNTEKGTSANIEDTINSIKNQSFHYWKYDLLKDIDLKKKIKNIKEDYILIVKSGEILDNTFLECAYWTMEKNKSASFCYSNQVIRDNNKLLDTLCIGTSLKVNNTIGNTFVIRKEELINYYDNKKKDEANVSLSASILNYLLKNDKFPVKMNYYGIWAEKEVEDKLSKEIKDNLIGINYPVGVSYYHNIPHELDWNKKNKKENGKINILFIFPWFRVGGADKFNYELISRMDKEKYNITIITTEPCPYIWRQKFENYAEIFDLTSFMHRENWAGFIDYIIKTRNIDLVMNSNSYYGFYAIPWLKSLNPEVIFTDYLHALNFTWRNGEYPTDSTAISNILDETFVSSNEITKVMKEQMGRENDNVKTIYIGVDSKKFAPDNNEIVIPEELKYLENEKDVLLFCARISEEKRPLLMIKIMEKVVNKRPNAKLLVVGDGPMLDLMKEEAKKLNLENNVIFLGMQKEVRPYYKLAKLLVICSIREGITLTTFEALSMGIPVVSADVGGQKELIDSSCGLLVNNIQTIEEVTDTNYSEEEINNYCEAINKILDDSNYDKYKKNARKKIEGKFELEKMVKELESEFERLVKKGTNVAKDIINNKTMNAQYLLLFNEVDKRYYNNPEGGFGEVQVFTKYEKEKNKRYQKENQLKAEIEARDTYIKQKEEELEKIYNSKRWRYTGKIINIFKKK